jgi:hypothetical protein
MEKDGIVRRSDSPWSSPLHMVMKPDGSWRPCSNYRRLNLVTTKDSYPLPNMADFVERLEGCIIFSKVDVRKGYHQIRMHTADISQTAIITPFGQWELLRMTFGLRKAGNTFQRYMDRVLDWIGYWTSSSYTWMMSSSPAGQRRSIFSIFGSSSSGSMIPPWSSTVRSVFLELALWSFWATK